MRISQTKAQHIFAGGASHSPIVLYGYNAPAISSNKRNAHLVRSGNIWQNPRRLSLARVFLIENAGRMFAEWAGGGPGLPVGVSGWLWKV